MNEPVYFFWLDGEDLPARTLTEFRRDSSVTQSDAERMQVCRAGTSTWIPLTSLIDLSGDWRVTPDRTASGMTAPGKSIAPHELYALVFLAGIILLGSAAIVETGPPGRDSAILLSLQFLFFGLGLIFVGTPLLRPFIRKQEAAGKPYRLASLKPALFALAALVIVAIVTPPIADHNKQSALEEASRQLREKVTEAADKRDEARWAADRAAERREVFERLNAPSREAEAKTFALGIEIANDQYSRGAITEAERDRKVDRIEAKREKSEKEYEELLNRP